MNKFLLRTLEQVSRAFVITYAAAWQVQGLEYDNLFTQINLEAAAVGAVLSLLACLGVKNIGEQDRPTVQ